MCSARKLTPCLLLIFTAATHFVVASSAGLFPDDYDTFATRLTNETFDVAFQEAIAEADSTLFVRWHAGEHCRSCRLQSKAWYFAGRLFKHNPHVQLADVDIRQYPDLMGPPYFPGRGGWPTIWYFNEETDVLGAPYVPQTDMTLSQELGPEHAYLYTFIEKAADTVLCDNTCHPDEVEDSSCSGGTDVVFCNERSRKYRHRLLQKDESEWYSELAFLNDMQKEKSSETSADPWIAVMKKMLLDHIEDRADVVVNAASDEL